ncbi:MAG: CsgG/HfaB family protein [candidate division KSB1 bacterium]|nr:CsgG/HfaB family protein [candidate division KSB1 bacterium]MDZ7318204.1 CsgG/HfaB family protein [candidate division KSB1 bacterium]MDZ7341595.1 CsgG/HfaB family protein [candidate division KSB1 bacterium]
MRSGWDNQCSHPRFCTLVPVALFLISLITSCAILPELEPYGSDREAKPPEYAPFAGLKRRVAVLDFENRSEIGGSKLGSAVADMLVYQLFRSGRFILVERSQLDQILQEQALGQSGAVSETTAAQVGQLVGAHCLILGTILEAQQQTSSRKIEDKKDQWRLRLKTIFGLAHLSFKVVDTQTGEVLLADHFSATEIRPGFGLETKDVDFKDMTDFDQTVIGKAIRKAVQRMAERIVTEVDRIDWVGKVVQAQSDSAIYFTPGKSAGVQVNQFFEIYEKSPMPIDNEFSIDETLRAQPKARIRVIGFIGDKVARAQLVQGAGIQTGDLVRPTKQTSKIIEE